MQLNISKSEQYSEKAHLIFLIDKDTDLSSTLLSSYKTFISSRMDQEKDQAFYVNDDQRQLYVAYIHQDGQKSESETLQDIRALGSKINKLVNGDKIEHATYIKGSNTISSSQSIAFIEGIRLSNYQFLKYKSGAGKEAYTLQHLNVVDEQLSEKELHEITNVTDGTMLARDLVNEPVITLNAEKLSAEIEQAGKEAGFSTTIFDKKKIEELKMGGVLGVNRGSEDPPTFNIMEWKPKNAVNSQPVILVGKGIVYDTGGYSIKPGNSMMTMKCDMGGAAAVVGTMYAVAKNEMPVHVIGLIPATDNRIGKNALVADDIITMYDGTTVEILNTDAEGRLVLADALAYAKQYNPQLVIDLATLTGHGASITGTFGMTMMGNADEERKKALVQSGDTVYERCAEMPFWREYGELLKSPVADIKNIGGPVGGTITAGKFLEHFVDYPWIHLDIAGPAFLKEAEAYKPKGGSGTGVRLLYHYIKGLQS